MLSDKPPIQSTIPNLPATLLDQLLKEISTLASVYHKPPETFVGQGRFGAEVVKKRAIEEQREAARENANPLAAAAADAAAGGGKSNIENLLDIDFDGAAPASASAAGGLADLMGDNGVSNPSPPAGMGGSGLDDLLSLSMGGGEPSNGAGSMGGLGGLENGFGGLDLSGTTNPPAQNNKPKTNEDILGLF